MARELVNRIQNLRKKSGLEITDRITVEIEPSDASVNAISSFGDYVSRQVLADAIRMQPNDGQEVEFDDFNLHIKIAKS